MEKIPIKVIESLLIATDQYVGMCKQLPPEKEFMFRVEGLMVLDLWPEFYNKMMVFYINPAAQTKKVFVRVSNENAAKMTYYFNLMAEFYASLNDEKDRGYLDGVSYYMITYTKYKKTLTSKHQEELFWSAFPK